MTKKHEFRTQLYKELKTMAILESDIYQAKKKKSKLPIRLQTLKSLIADNKSNKKLSKFKNFRAIESKLNELQKTYNLRLS